MSAASHILPSAVCWRLTEGPTPQQWVRRICDCTRPPFRRALWFWWLSPACGRCRSLLSYIIDVRCRIIRKSPRWSCLRRPRIRQCANTWRSRASQRAESWRTTEVGEKVLRSDVPEVALEEAGVGRENALVKPRVDRSLTVVPVERVRTLSGQIKSFTRIFINSQLFTCFATTLF